VKLELGFPQVTENWKVWEIRWGSAPDPAGGAYITPPDPLVALNIAP